MKTIEHYLNNLSNPYREQALNNTGEKNLKRKVSSLNEALMSAFPWQGSPEGYRYWFVVRDKEVYNL